MKCNIRNDSWSSVLTEDQRWQLYYKSNTPGPWTSCVEWAKKEFGVDINPSGTAFYRWKRAMRASEHEHHMEESAIASVEAAAIAGKVTDDKTMIDMYKQMGVELAMKFGDAKGASAFVRAAVAIHDRVFKSRELKLKKLAQTSKDKQIELAREKWEAAERRLAAVKETVASAKANGGLTPETLKKIEEAAGLL